MDNVHDGFTFLGDLYKELESYKTSLTANASVQERIVFDLLLESIDNVAAIMHNTTFGALSVPHITENFPAVPKIALSKWQLTNIFCVTLQQMTEGDTLHLIQHASHVSAVIENAEGQLSKEVHVSPIIFKK